MTEPGISFRIARVSERDVGPFEERPYRSTVSTFLRRNDPNYIVDDLGDRDFGGISGHGLKLTQTGTEQDGDSNPQTQQGWEGLLMDVLRDLDVGCVMFSHS